MNLFDVNSYTNESKWIEVMRGVMGLQVSLQNSDMLHFG